MAENLVIVESPAKAKTIAGYLGKDYRVLASYGHIRDLPSKQGSVLPDEDFAMRWELNERASPRLKEIQTALKSAKTLLLATDPDREGEAIAWHLHHVLGEDNKLAGKKVERVVFHEITKAAISKAIENTRPINQDLVDAYLARRALDYLVGFSISPLLWRKISRAARSAGRVQSVALRLICDREAEIELFKPKEFWTIAGLFNKAGKKFITRLTHFQGKKLDKFSIDNEADASKITKACNDETYRINHVTKKMVERAPAPPFTTSTLQQDAANKLGFRAIHTMKIAQKLYEGISIGGKTTGLISYMRTDSVNLSAEAIADASALVAKQFGDKYILDKPRHYKTKVKNAQEAHEAIRPTNFHLTPDTLRTALDHEQFKLYELIWKRALATQMANAKFEKAVIELQNPKGDITFRANGSILVFDGYQKLYLQAKPEDEKDNHHDTQEEDDENKLLPPLAEGETPSLDKVDPAQHFTMPPARYSDASLVKKLEELGIGRPSTYAPILQVLIGRKYVHLDKRRFIPDDIGRIIVGFLELYFPEQIEYDFTAHMEDKLDEISHGDIGWKKVLSNFWQDFHHLIDRVEEVQAADISHQLDEKLAFHYFPENGDKTPEQQRLCPSCQKGRLELKTGKFGAFIACNNYPDCRYTSPISSPVDDETAGDMVFPKLLGNDPVTGFEVTLRKGPYGLYLQLSDAETLAKIATEKAEAELQEVETGAGAETDSDADSKGKKAKAKTKAKKPKKPKKPVLPKPKRSPLPKLVAANMITLDMAVDLLRLPRDVGTFPETGDMIQAGIGPFGPFLKYGTSYVSLKDDDVLEVGINRAINLVAEHKKKREGISLGKHPDSGNDVLVRYGRYGRYLQHGDATFPLGRKAEYNNIELTQAVALLANAPISYPKKPAAKKPAAKKPAAKKAAAAKTAKPS